MKLNDALSHIRPITGLSSAMHAVAAGDLSSVQPPPSNPVEPGAAFPELHDTRSRIQALESEQAACNSEAARWGYEAQLAYLRARRDILEAATLVGEHHLPDGIDPPHLEGDLMGACSRMEGYGAAVLDAARSYLSPEGHVNLDMGGDSTQPVGPGQRRVILSMTQQDLQHYAQPLLGLISGFHQGGADPHVLLATTMFALGQMMFFENLALNPDAPLSKAMGPLVEGFNRAKEGYEQAVAREAAAQAAAEGGGA